MLTATQEIKRLEAVLNGETVEGLRLGDPGIEYKWVVQRIADLYQMKRERRQKAAFRRKAQQ